MITKLFFFLILIGCGVTDAATRRIPDRFPLLLFFLAVLQLFAHPARIVSSMIGCFIPAAGMLLLCLWRGGLGGGDIKLTAACGLYLGIDTLLWGLLFACIGALFVQSVLFFLPFSQQKNEPAPFAFGPFLAFGFILSSLICS